ncbi:hypothetical protein C8F04DRAFT_1097973 [Mycena alexandri]|uniref:Uncharacterized protein n=1 Tax=Mycena alexandri TaxID=1745969 RepID=A0AAD6SXI5_9AGAR|nr:hypothetical protein C8F04DRAFT_1097973 [Mycena alexandri]
MMRDGSLGVAIVARQVMVVQAARTHTRRDRFLDVYTFLPFSFSPAASSPSRSGPGPGPRTGGTFLATPAPKARITTSDILTIFPPADVLATRAPAPGMLELPEEAWREFTLLSERMQQRYEKMWEALGG